jgi:2-polyprenyl-6-methoxyphenol hydroxylase-like FAD-dependent oxidoreductase
MTSDGRYDVAVVGASIAGSTAAILFGRRGLKVALIDRESAPKAYKKICTHFIQASATPTIERIGLASRIEAAGGIRNGLNVWTRWGWIREPNAPDGSPPPFGYNIRREKLDPILREIAANSQGVDFMPGRSARGINLTNGRPASVVTEGTNLPRREIAAQLLVAADGRNSRIGELASVRPRIKPNRRFGYFAYFRDVSLASGNKSQMWMLEPDAVYTFPNDDGLTILAALPIQDKVATWKQNLEQSFMRAFDSLPDGPAVNPAKRESEILGILEMPNVSRPAARPGLAFIGDAALAADPLWGVGCGWAFQSAEWLVDCVSDALHQGRGLDRALNQYRRMHRWRTAGHEFMISDYSSGRAFNPIEKLMFSSGARDPACAAHVAAFGARSIGVSKFLSPQALARAAKVNLGYHLRSRLHVSGRKTSASA